MVFVIIIVLSLIATYLLLTSGIFDSIPWLKKVSEDIESIFDVDIIEPGMLGSAPSDSIDVYDSKKPITIPMEGAINTLIESFKTNANIVYKDFTDNKNSVKYKEYIFDDYKLELLRRNDNLTEEQLAKYFTIRNTIVSDINNLFTYYLDKIKYSEDKSYFTLRREIINTTNNTLILDEHGVDQITNYVLSNTKIPGNIILLLKYKISGPAQSLLDQIVMLAGFNYTTVLETLEQILIREPLPGISILGIVNSPQTTTGDEILISQGFWTQVFFTFRANNIDNFLIGLIKLSFMTEQIYRSILATIASNMQNTRITDSLNAIVKMCRSSDNKLIRTFPFNFAHALLMDGINENRFMLRSDRIFDIANVDREVTGISNIDQYTNLENNFPVSIQSFIAGTSSGTKTVDYTNPFYPILSSEYVINNYISFPDIKHCGIYFDRTTAVPVDKSGYLLISNISNLLDLTISGIIIYATLQDGFISNDYRNIQETVDDKNIVNNSAIIAVDSGRYNGLSWTPNDDESIITTKWLSGASITIPATKSLRIRATKQVSTVGIRYLRIYAILIPFVTKPVSDFLRITSVGDTSANGEIKVMNYNFLKIPSVMPNLLVTFDVPYSITTIANRVSDTFSVFSNSIANAITVVKITGASGSTLTADPANTSVAKTSIFTSTNGVSSLQPSYSNIPIAIGLINDRITTSASDPNIGRKTFRLKLKNNSSGPIVITKLIVFGNVAASTEDFTNNVTLNSVLADDNLLLRNTMINTYTMNDTETTITGNTDNSFIIDSINKLSNGSYNLNSGSSIYIEPVVSAEVNRYVADRYMCIRALYIELSGVDTSKIDFTIIDLEKSKFATFPAITNIWSNNATLIMFNAPIGANAATYSHFTILPNYKDNYSILPNYRESKFQSDYYDNDYNPISELVQYPANFY